MKKFALILCAFLTVCLCSSFKISHTNQFLISTNTTESTSKSLSYKAPKSKSTTSRRSSYKSSKSKKSKTVRVKGYYRKDGKYVPSHTRKAPKKKKK